MREHKRHRSKARAAKGAALLVALAAIGIAGFWIEQSRFHGSETVDNDTTTISQFETSHSGTGTITNPASQPGASDGVRWVFGHSLVPGGIRTIAELANLIGRDPKLADHYRDFDLSKGRVVTLDRDSLVFVSYRMDGAIFWQARPTVIRRGERVLTDGTNMIRARCGNRVVSFPAFPTSPAEPTDMEIVVGKLTEPPGAPSDPGEMPIESQPITPPITVPEWAASPLLPQPEPVPSWFVPVPIINPSPPPGMAPNPLAPPFGADEFSSVRLTIFGHAHNISTGLLTLLAGVVLATVLRLAAWRSR